MKMVRSEGQIGFLILFQGVSNHMLMRSSADCKQSLDSSRSFFTKDVSKGSSLTRSKNTVILLLSEVCCLRN